MVMLSTYDLTEWKLRSPLPEKLIISSWTKLSRLVIHGLGCKEITQPMLMQSFPMYPVMAEILFEGELTRLKQGKKPVLIFCNHCTAQPI